MKVIDIKTYKQKKSGGDVLSYEESVLNFIKIVVYYINHTSTKLYKTKLHKMLFYTQFVHYKKYHELLISGKFIKNHYGPVLENIDLLLDEAENLGAIIRKSTDYGTYIDTNITIPEEDYGNELNTIRLIGDKFSNYTARDISDYSHNESLWINTNTRDEISIDRVEELNEL